MNPSMDVKKPLRARKTMTPSSRKQVEMLGKMKCTQGAEKPSNGASSEGHDFPLKRVETRCLFPTSVKQLDLKQTQLVPQMLKEPVANLLVNSKISIYNDRQELSKDLTYNPCGTDSDVKQFLNAGALQDILYSWYEKESGSPLFKPVEVHLNSRPESQPAEPPQGPFSRASPKAAVPAVAKAMEEALVDQSTPELEREGATIQRHKKTVIPSVQPDYARGKRRHSESSEDAFCKHIKTSDDAREACDASSGQKQHGLEKVKSFIQSQMATSMEGLDHHLRRLRESIDRTQCLRKHEDIAIKIVKRISRLDRRINTVIAFQKTELSRKASRPGASVPDETPSCSAPPPGKADGKAVPSNPSSAKGSDDVVCVDLMNKNSGVEAVNAAGVQRKGSSADASTVAKTSGSSKDLFLIDLTDEESSAGQAGKEKEKQVAVRRRWAAEPATPVPPPPPREGANEVLKDFSHLPPLPKVRVCPEHMSEFQNTLPPQQLELAVAQVQNPKGIALQWNVRKEDPRCAPIESFHLFICLEGPKTGAPSAWMETNKIKALPLPMACSLSQFPGSARCYFVMQSRDIYGRYGPFCDIQAISPV
ncbi:activating transcription factor 7-interacting protein 2 [Varanus komodoensis]|uniref:activating transcription factor 7-interacting protein 2 n=1 Tax=Varanus komodoensis TaxID=61221 RepID=UPI001CF796D4|nr:activating transcription factor 7-interacting protein 2 [Varanus komodoensis]